MRELKRRGVIRNVNNPVGDIGEFRAADMLHLVLAGPSCKGFDATDSDRLRYQIKIRSRGARGWRNLMGFRDFEEHLFDRFAVVVLELVTLDVQLFFHFSYEVAVEYIKNTMRGFKKILLNSTFLRDPGLTWVVGQPSMVVKEPVTRPNPSDSALRPDRTFHDAIEIVLLEAGPEALTAGEIYHRIRERDLYRQKAGTPVTRQQVAKRVSIGSRFVAHYSVYPRIIKLREYR